MVSRRRALSTIGLSVASASALLAEDRRHRSRWDMIFNADETEPAPIHPDPRSWSNDAITVSWIGHSTILIDFLGVRIITDPVLSDRIGLAVAGLFTLGPKRLVAPALSFEELPPIDLILLSHAHMDHLDLPTLKKFDKGVPMIMAANTSDVVDALDGEHVHELDWGETRQVAGVQVEALKVKHFGWRFPWEEDRSKGRMDGRSYNAYLLTRNGRSIVFGGDTSYHEQFRGVGSRGVNVELAMMPIGAYDPWIYNHASPEQAVAMAGHCGATTIVPMHWNTFIQSDEPRHEPIERLRAAAKKAGMNVALDTIGQTWSTGTAL